MSEVMRALESLGPGQHEKTAVKKVLEEEIGDTCNASILESAWCALQSNGWISMSGSLVQAC